MSSPRQGVVPGPDGTTWHHPLRRLVGDGAVDADDVHAGRVTVVRLSRSHEIGELRVDDEPRLILKRHGTGEAHDPFFTESSVIRALRRRAELAHAVPDCIAVWPDLRTIALSVVNGRHLHDTATGRPLPHDLSTIGSLLARIHRAGDLVHPRELAPRPWILGVPDDHLPSHVIVDPEAAAIAREIGRHPELADTIRSVGSRWEESGLVHGDLKFDNVLVDDGGGTILIDWEFATLGPPEWDLAGIADGVVLPAIRSKETRALGRVHAMQPALDAFHAAGGSISDSMLEACTVARLCQSAIQLMAMRGHDATCAEQARSVVEHTVELAELLVTARCPA